ncbi:hypothetical protein [Crocinitomix catalasitica]|uniref:hypothetical protein n=1 Tax=Crocinitomix catalasitica TaxID=184607 RepID=UPI00047F5B30|nr:hypothetical protein [Crocinitomix catalasitica]
MLGKILSFYFTVLSTLILFGQKTDIKKPAQDTIHHVIAHPQKLLYIKPDSLKLKQIPTYGIDSLFIRTYDSLHIKSNSPHLNKSSPKINAKK